MYYAFCEWINQLRKVGKMHGVPHGLMLGPVLFVRYTTPFSDIIANHTVNHQLFADDTQLQ